MIVLNEGSVVDSVSVERADHLLDEDGQVLDRVPADVALGELPKSVAVPGRADNVLRWGKERGGGERNADGSNNKGRETERAGK